ncbi:unnamed protein product [Clavelina lepadiformis]|uniref:Carbohydrate sulfotransferase n=1 Tax=Clavelina lepadiformis TaxID=159417 RepID=A0ABP0G680_CLALP
MDTKTLPEKNEMKKQALLKTIFVGCVLHILYQVFHFTTNFVPEYKQLKYVPAASRSVQEIRQINLKAACRSFENEESIFNESYLSKQNMYSKTYKFAVCEIQKCGSGAWLKLLLITEGFYTMEEYFIDEKMRGEKVLQIASEQLSLWPMQNKSEQRKIWKNAFKVIMVRNPFDRIVSAYVDKLVPGALGFNYFYEPMSRKINQKYRHLRHDVESRTRADNGTATFEDFLNYLIDTDGGEDNPHFTFYHALCNPCKVHYDYIIKFETMQEDIEFLQNYLNISEEHRKIFFPPARYSARTDKVKKFYEQTPKELTNKLYSVYKKDFVLFDYDRAFPAN